MHATFDGIHRSATIYLSAQNVEDILAGKLGGHELANRVEQQVHEAGERFIKSDEWITALLAEHTEVHEEITVAMSLGKLLHAVRELRTLDPSIGLVEAKSYIERKFPR